jgi:hypothetical protein
MPNPNGSGQIVHTYPLIEHDQALTFGIPSYGDFFSFLRAQHFTIVGSDYCFSPQMIDGSLAPHWLPYQESKLGTWLCESALQFWNDLAHSAKKARNLKLFDLSKRLRFQIWSTSHRLRQVSEEYHRELLNLTINNKQFVIGGWVSTMNIYSIFSAIHAYLVDACILRDLLASFLAKYKFAHESPAISTMSSLRKLVLHDKGGSDSWSTRLFTVTDKTSQGWLWRLGALRDAIVHIAPLSQTQQWPHVRPRMVSLSSGHEMPCLSVPIITDPVHIEQMWQKDIMASTVEDWEIKLRSCGEHGSCEDALTYLHRAHMQLIALLGEAQAFSPIAPQRPVIDASEVSNLTMVPSVDT